MTSEKKVLLDVRTKDEYSEGNVPGSVNIPLDELPSKIDTLDKESKIIVFCASGMRASAALKILKQQGFADVTCAGSWRDVLNNETYV